MDVLKSYRMAEMRMMMCDEFLKSGISRFQFHHEKSTFL